MKNRLKPDVVMSKTLPVTCNVFQAFRCRSGNSVADYQVPAVTSRGAKKGKSGAADEPDVPSKLRPNKRPRQIREAKEPVIAAACSPIALEKIETISEIEEDRCCEPVANRQILKKERGEERPSASGTAPVAALTASGAFVLSADSLKARGRQKIPLENAKGLPERLGDMPLRLVVGGNNPSDHAWSTGHYYSHPANWMWRILKKTGIAPSWVNGAEDDERMLSEAGVGFLDVGCGHPGTLLSEFSSQTFQSWAPAFYARLKAHMVRACSNSGCTCGECGAPAVVGFAGKRQWMELLNVGRKGRDKYTKLDHGVQQMRPQVKLLATGCVQAGVLVTQGWPFPPGTEVWVLPSTSGAAPMSTADRIGPWQELADRVKFIEWPRKPQCLLKD